MTLRWVTGDGRELTCEPVRHDGIPGQIVILDGVSLGDSDPLRGYSQPCAFTITHVDAQDDTYVLTDTLGGKVRVPSSHGYRLFPVNPWLGWKKATDEEDRKERDRAMARLGERAKILEEILVKQGLCALSALEQAKKLGASS